MLTKDRVREIVEVRLAALAPALLRVLACGFSVDDFVTLTMDTRFRLAEAGETETPEASFTWWQKHLR